MNPNILLVYENNHIDPSLSHVFVILLNVGFWLLAAFCLRKMMQSRRKAREAKLLEDAHAPLALGNRFVSGTVELARGEARAIDVTITQSGRQQKTKNGHSHSFTEVHRETRARPFYLRHASGARIRVEPPRDVLLVDELDQFEWHERNTRRRRAELVPGEWAVVEGVLEEGSDPEADPSPVGYRTAPNRGHCMRPPREGRMEVSSEHLSRRHELRARLFLKTIFAVVLTATLGNVFLFGYWDRVIEGKDVVADLTKKDIYTTRDSKGRTTTHYGLYVAYEDGAGRRVNRVIDVDDSDYEIILVDRTRVWVRATESFRSLTSLGSGVSLSVMGYCFAWIPFFIALGIVSSANGHRRWYEGRVNDSGSGELPNPSGQRFREQRPAPDHG